ncbi:MULTISPECIES: SLC13 family permease [unclassified Pantoea]|uniref:SLC13 family permease n=1 Tax=unclassified Pantoea TaxID=2630326 RepID=UPI001CD76E74|nr:MULTISPECIES: SLC13 family permease [unclassified Pantoea]MCA1177272.1 anion permease [Pantoea sp. alder69]MCA1253538.1 anion permease [Pantoea sp. alder70]MCA1265761.1 anion permease [Pantoea sp. alder81]
MHFWLTTLVIAITILLWASARLPEYLTALLFFAAATLLNIAPTSTIFSGFASSAFWLVLSGFVLGAAIRKVGLAQRWANYLVVPLSQSWPRMVVGTLVLTYLLALVMPSNMGRIALLMPVVLAMGERAGIKAGSRGSIGLALAVGFGTFQLSASILPANVPNLVLSGAAENAYQIHLQWLPWWLLHMPVVGIGKGMILAAAILFLFHAQPQSVRHRDQLEPLSRSEWRLMGLLAMTLLLWMTDSLHGLPAAWVGLAAACICLLPRIGFLSGDDFASGVNFRTCIYIAGILGVATVVVDSGLGRLIANLLLSVLPLQDHASFGNFAVLNALVSLLNFVLTANGVPAMVTPIAQELANASGFSLISVVMMQVFAYATPLLPYQASPVVVAMGLGNVPAKAGLQLCVLVFIFSVLLLLPLDYLWFRLLGYA